jgi:hypothetical protein
MHCTIVIGTTMKLTAAAAAATLLFGFGEARAQPASAVDQISAIAVPSRCASINWNDRGLAPKAYIRGIAVVFAKAVCTPDRAEVAVVSAARGTPGSDLDRTDGLTWYDPIFRDLGMRNDVGGLDTLRHAYALLIGLGMRESSGEHCVGRDRSANFSTADSAEAGLFQTSWGANVAHPTMSALFDRYRADGRGCLLDLFSRNVSCSRWDARTWGEGKGAEWQQLTKSCPAFATEYAAVLLRTSGGARGEFGPIRRRQAQVRSECDAMLARVQALAQTDPQICAALR